MFKNLRLALMAASLSSLIISCNNSGSEQNSEKAEQEDGMQQAMEQEFRMTKDPLLNDVPTERLFAAMEVAERKSFDQNRTTAAFTWTERGPDNIGGRTRAILVDKADPTGNTVLVGSVGGGIWRCTNFKSTSYAWSKANDHMPNLAVSSLAQDPVNTNIMYAGTGEGVYNADAIRGGGIYKSIDGGVTWNRISSTADNSTFAYVQDIVITQNGHLYATTRGSYCNYGGVMKSTDGGDTWSRVVGTYNNSGACSGAFNMRGVDLEIAANGDLYASTGLGSSSSWNLGRVWKSPASLGAMQGEVNQWTEITPTPPTGETGFRRIEVAVAPTNSQLVYLLCQKYNDATITMFYKSTNGGTTWTAVTPPTWCDQGNIRSDFTRSQAWYDLIATFDPNNSNVLLVGGVDVMKSSNGGDSFDQMTRWSGSSACGALPIIHADQHNIVFMNGSSNDLIVSNDGGVYYSSNGGASFSSRNSGYNVTQYYSTAMHPAAGSNMMLGGAQDNGSHIFKNAGVNTVYQATGGDGAFCFIDQLTPNIQITSYVYSNFYISRNTGVSFSTGVSDNNGPFVNPADYDSRSKILFCGYTSGNLGRVTNIVSGTPQIQSVPVSVMGSQTISAVKVDPNIDNRVYLAASGAIPAVIRLDNANAVAPVMTTLNFPSLASGSYISSLDVEDGDANHLLATVSNFGIQSVFESTNGGTSWSDVEGDLPDMPIRWGIFLPSAQKRIALATDMGVWTTSGTSGTATAWTPDNIGLANVRVDMIKFRKSDSTIAIATHGRGIFTTTLSTLLPVTLMDFSGKLQGENAVLSWRTASEAKTKQFEIERSIDGNRFEKVGVVAAAGTSNSVREYGFRDKDAAKEVNYYRLKTVDIDNRSSYSKIILIRRNLDSKQSLDIITNPFTTYIDLKFGIQPKGTLKVQLTDLSGRVVESKTYAAGAASAIQRFTLSNAAISKGTYVVTAYSGGIRLSKKVVKQ